MSSRIEDWDTNWVDFQGSWGQREARTASETTVTVSERVGDKVTARFTGTSVEVWGSGIATNQAQRTVMGFDFLIDNQFVERFSQEVPIEPELQIFRLWTSPELPPGDHTIDVEIEELQNAAAVIDYFQVFTAGDARDASSSSQSQIFATITSPNNSTTSTATKPENSFLAPSNEAGGPRSSNGAAAPIGPIVGGVIGGVLFVLLAALALVWTCKRRRGSAEGGESEVAHHDKTTDSPVPVPAMHNESHREPSSTSQSSSVPLITPPQTKLRQQHSGPSQKFQPPPAQTKLRSATGTRSHHDTSLSFDSPPSSNPPASTIHGASASTQRSSSGAAEAPGDDHQVIEAIRTLQTYLQRQPEGLEQVVHGLGMSTTEHTDMLNPPPAYEERS